MYEQDLYIIDISIRKENRSIGKEKLKIWSIYIYIYGLIKDVRS